MISAAPPDQAGQQFVRQRYESRNIGIDHRLPLVDIRLIGAIGAERQTGVVDQQIDFAERGWQCRQCRIAPGFISHIEYAAMHLRTDLLTQSVQPIGSAACADNVPAGPRERPKRCFTDAGCRACNECCSRHFFPSPKSGQSERLP